VRQGSPAGHAGKFRRKELPRALEFGDIRRLETPLARCPKRVAGLVFSGVRAGFGQGTSPVSTRPTRPGIPKAAPLLVCRALLPLCNIWSASFAIRNRLSSKQAP
jgi:hypothetical protein